MSMKVFNKTELKQYCIDNSDKLIILIHGIVYDITKFIDEVCQI